MSLGHYAEAFTVAPGRCFRMVTKPHADGQPTHCENVVAWSGSFRAGDGRRYRVQACDGHADELADKRPVRSA